MTGWGGFWIGGGLVMLAFAINGAGVDLARAIRHAADVLARTGR